jgi:hypothetical protein
MDYRAEFLPIAAAAVQALPPHLRRAVRDRIRDLCKDPVNRSRPTFPPQYPPGYQMIRFFAGSEDEMLFFVVLFKYHEDEQTLLIYAVAYGDALNHLGDMGDDAF